MKKTPDTSSLQPLWEQAIVDENYELASELAEQEEQANAIRRARLTPELIARVGFDYLRSHKPRVPPDVSPDK